MLPGYSIVASFLKALILYLVDAVVGDRLSIFVVVFLIIVENNGFFIFDYLVKNKRRVDFHRILISRRGQHSGDIFELYIAHWNFFAVLMLDNFTSGSLGCTLFSARIWG